TELSRSSREPNDFIEMSLHAAPSIRRDPDDSIIDEIRSTFGKRLDLVVPIGGPAAAFAQNRRQQLFPTIPVLMASVDSRFVGARSLSANETAVMVRHDLPQMLESILRLLPDTRTVVVVIGASTHDNFWLEEVKHAFRPFEGQLRFVWTNQWSYAELLKQCGMLPPHSVILYGLLMLDANGTPQREEQTLDALHATA